MKELKGFSREFFVRTATEDLFLKSLLVTTSKTRALTH